MFEIEDTEELRQRLAAAEELNAQLMRALDSRVVIEQAKGVLAERLGLDVDEAFEVLRYGARSARVNLRELAGRVVHDARTPNAIVIALARRSRWRAALMRERSEAIGAEMPQLGAGAEARIARADPRPRSDH